MLGFLLWLALLTAAGLCYPRRPRLTGALFIVLGMLSVALAVDEHALFVGLNLQRDSGYGLAALAGSLWLALGAWYLVKYRHPEARAKHVQHWTAKT
jgi:hypothetical protein